MIKHIVLLKFKHGLSDEEIAEVPKGFERLKGSIPGIVSFRWVRNNSEENLDKGYLHGFEMELEDADARRKYLEHPDHVKFATEVIVPRLENGFESIMVFDYEV